MSNDASVQWCRLGQHLGCHELLHVGEGLHAAVWHQHHWHHHNSWLTLARELVLHANLLVCQRLSHEVAAHHHVLSTTENLKLFHLLIVAGGLSAEDLGGISILHVSEILPPPGIWVLSLGNSSTPKVLEALRYHSLCLMVSSTIEIDFKSLSQAHLSLGYPTTVKVLSAARVLKSLRLNEIKGQGYGRPSLSWSVVA